DGQILIAAPGIRDRELAGSIIYVCAHSHEGAMGLVLNQRSKLTFSDLLTALEVIPKGTSAGRAPQSEAIAVLKGGPVEDDRGFVLHSSDFFIENSTLPIDDGICLTASLDILEAIAQGRGPKSAILALGYCGWSAGELENDIQENNFLHCS